MKACFYEGKFALKPLEQETANAKDLLKAWSFFYLSRRSD